MFNTEFTIMNLYKKTYALYFLHIFWIAIFISEAEKKHWVCEKYTEQACGKTRSSNLPSVQSVGGNIVGGNVTGRIEFPHMAAVGYSHYDSKKWYCGGSLISESFVLTAAHCAGSQDLYVRFGNPDLTTAESDPTVVIRKIIQVYIHPDFVNKASGKELLYNDIALLRFEPISNFTDNIRPVCLNVLRDFHRQQLVAIGWGDTYTRKARSGPLLLLAVKLELQKGESCKSVFPEAYNDETMICVGHLPGGKDSCKGDSGGPLQYLNNPAWCSRVPIYSQVGLVSKGQGCALPNMPAAYTRISHFIKWIESII